MRFDTVVIKALYNAEGTDVDVVMYPSIWFRDAVPALMYLITALRFGAEHGVPAFATLWQYVRSGRRP